MNLNDTKLIGRRIDKLDKLFLNTTSLIGIFFGIIQVIIGGVESLKYFIPLFLLVWFIPIYIGYFKGAIVYDRISERIRGWLYFFENSLIYCVFLGLYFFRTKAQKNISHIDNIIVLFLIVLIFLLSVVIYKGFFKLFKGKVSDVEKRQIKGTITNPLLLGLATLLFIIIINVEIYSLEDFLDIGFIVGSAFALFLVSIVVYNEFKNKKILSYKNPKVVQRTGFTKISLILILLIIICFLALLFSIYIFQYYLAILPLSFLFLAIFFLYFESHNKTEIIDSKNSNNLDEFEEKKRNIEREKGILRNLHLLVWVWVLGAATLTVYLFAKLGTEGDPNMNFYIFGMLAGWTGGVWGIGLHEAVSFWKWTKSGDDWHSEETYRKNLHKWIIMGVISLVYVFVFSIFVNFFKL